MVIKNKKLILLVIVGLLLVGGGVCYAITHYHHGQLTKSGVIKTTDTESSNSTASGTGSANQTSTTGIKATGGKDVDSPPAGSELLVPSGNFVSSHSISLETANEESVCLTSPGASCSITFTKNGITKTLPAQTTDNTGATVWHWNAKDSGLTEGNWHIAATATLGDQKKTVNDLQDLTVRS